MIVRTESRFAPDASALQLDRRLKKIEIYGNLWGMYHSCRFVRFVVGPSFSKGRGSFISGIATPSVGWPIMVCVCPGSTAERQPSSRRAMTTTLRRRRLQAATGPGKADRKITD